MEKSFCTEKQKTNLPFFLLKAGLLLVVFTVLCPDREQKFPTVFRYKPSE